MTQKPIEIDSEEFFPVPGDPGYYITQNGKVGKFNRLKANIDKVTGYMNVNVKRGDRWHCVAIHSLLLKTFVGPRPPGMQCRHLDGDRSNNDLDNLVWGTPSENKMDSVRHGTASRRGGPRKLTSEQVAEVRELLASGISRSELASRFRVSYNVIRDIHLQRRYL